MRLIVAAINLDFLNSLSVKNEQIEAMLELTCLSQNTLFKQIIKDMIISNL